MKKNIIDPLKNIINIKYIPVSGSIYTPKSENVAKKRRLY